MLLSFNKCLTEIQQVRLLKAHGVVIGQLHLLNFSSWLEPANHMGSPARKQLCSLITAWPILKIYNWYSAMASLVRLRVKGPDAQIS